jgi:acyl-CoA synthetase (AMP-forming)/AMP-acid ligase II
MLYDLWLEKVRRQPSRIALWEAATDRRWSFSELARAAEDSPSAREPFVFPRGGGAQFILSVLQGWRDNAVVCPLESDQAAPAIVPPPPGCRHLKLTSATSGLPRMVAFTEAQLAADAENIVATMGLRPDWPNLAAISMAHSYGFSNLVLPLLLHGIPLLLSPSALPEVVRRAAAPHSSLTLAGVPALWRAWHEAGAIPPNIALAISAGAPLSLELEQAVYAAWKLKIHNFYGSSECGGIAYDDRPEPRREEGLVGRPMANVALSLSPEGCLQIRSRAVAETYWPAPDGALGQGCFQTNDVAELSDRAVFLRGRAGDLMNVAGRKIAPETVERALRGHAGVKDCLVFAVPDARGERSDRIVACVVANAPLEPEALKQFLLKTLPAWQVPRDWWFVDSLTPNQRGKLSRHEWREKYLSPSRHA